MGTKYVPKHVIIGIIWIILFTSSVLSSSIGTAFTYQGHLYDNNDVANDLYDFQFRLYDANVGGSQIGNDVNVPDVDVIDGYFTIELDFGSSAFDGEGRWLEIGVRPGEFSDPNVYTVLIPKQPITPTPYATYAQNAGGDNDWRVTGNDMYSIPSGDVGIGTANPHTDLEIEGTTGLRVTTGQHSNVFGEFRHAYSGGLQINANAGGGWADISLQTDNTTRFFVESAGNIGIGTTTPGYKLDVFGDSRIGWHGSSTRVKIIPSDFLGGDDDPTFAATTFFNDGINRGVMSRSGPELYAFVNIPTGYKATHVKIYGNDGESDVYIYEGYITNGTWNIKGNGTVNTEIDIIDVSSTSTNYLVILVAVSQYRYIYGGYVTIERI